MLKFIEGFDSYDAVANIADGRKWTNSANLTSYGSLVTGRIAGQAMRLTRDTAYIRKALSTTYVSGVFGFALRVSGFNSSVIGTSPPVFSVLDSTYTSYGDFGTQVMVHVDGTGRIVVHRGIYGDQWSESTLLATSIKNLIKNAWHYIEVKLLIDNAAGYVIVNVDEEEWINETGLDTRQSGNDFFNGIQLGGDVSVNVDFDDFYFCDLTGSKNNDFLGDCVVSTLLPDGDTADADFTPDSGTDQYAMVNGTFDDDTGLESETVGHKTIVTLGSLPAAGIGTIAGVQVVARVKKDDAGTKSVRNVVVSGAAEDPQTAYALADQYTNNVDLLEDDPAEAAGTAWTESAVNAMQVGVEVTA
jgi:hypothetical protein